MRFNRIDRLIISHKDTADISLITLPKSYAHLHPLTPSTGPVAGRGISAHTFYEYESYPQSQPVPGCFVKKLHSTGAERFIHSSPHRVALLNSVLLYQISSPHSSRYQK